MLSAPTIKAASILETAFLFLQTGNKQVISTKPSITNRNQNNSIKELQYQRKIKVHHFVS